MNKIKYTNPEFKAMVEMIPADVSRELDLSFDIALRIEKLLERKGWSQADFARAAGKKEAEISKWMSGQHNFTIRTIAKIENVLGDKILHVKQFRSNTTNGSQHQMYKNSTSSISASMLADEKKRGYKKH